MTTSNDDLPVISALATTHIYRIPLPQTSSLSFESVFRGVDEPTTLLFEKITKARLTFTTCCSSEALAGAVDAIAAYVPLVNGLTAESQQKRELFAKVPMKIQWSTPLSIKHQFSFLASTNATDRFFIEQTFVLLSAGLCLRHLAREQLLAAGDSRNVDLFVEQSVLACKTLHKAAGLFEHVQTVMLPSWTGRLRGIVEMNENTYEMLAKLCLAESQSIAARRALARQQAVARRLFIGAAALWSETIALLDGMCDGEPRIKLLRSYAHTCCAQNKARALWLAAHEAHVKHSHGEACTLYRAALQERSVAQALEARARHEGGALEQTFFDVSASELVRLQRAQAHVQYENDKAFFVAEPRLDTLPTVEPAVIVKSEPFEVQATEIVTVQFKDSSCTIQ